MMSTLKASEKSKPHIELLPVELQCRILTSIPNMKTLRALLSASPRLFQVYKTRRELVLSHVAWNNITPAVVPIALDALEQRKNRKSTSHITRREPLQIPLETWESLIRFHRIVDSLVSNFASGRLVALENSMDPPAKNLSLSQLEYSRLARAFYHLEIYSYIEGFSKMGMLSESWTFMQSLREWEVEELLCVRSYMMESLIDYLNKFEEDFMKVYLKDKPLIIWPSRETRRLGGSRFICRPSEDSPRLNKPTLNWRCCLFVDDNFPAEWIESCLARGLKYLSAVIFAETLPDKFNALDHVDQYYHWISYALSNAERKSKKKVAAKIERPSENGFHNNTEQPNEAWFWASESKTYHGNLCNGYDTNDFQRWGYVIWDHARLERLGILQKSPSDIQATIGTDWLMKRAPKSLEARTREQEEAWSREGLQSALTEPRLVFDWEAMWFE